MKLKILLRHPIYIHQARKILSAKPPNKQWLNQRPIGLDLYTHDLLFDCGRHLESLAHYARSAGSAFYVRGTSLMLSGIAKKPFGRRMLAMPHVEWLDHSRPFPVNATVLIDSPDAHRTRIGYGSVTIKMLVGRDIPDDCPVMPYPMHPNTLVFNDATNIKKLRNNTQRKGIVFAGRMQPRYGHKKMNDTFGVLSRLDILEILQSILENSNTDQSSESVPIILRDSDKQPIASDEWLPFLARHRFFVCCPGVAQPLCHNLVEAMSVGTIPLIEYGNRLRPQLEDGVNAICFKGDEGLREAIRRIQGMSVIELNEMSLAAAAYHENYLRGDQFIASLRDGILFPKSEYVALPFHDQNFYSHHSLRKVA